jgi:hypothetical protein
MSGGKWNQCRPRNNAEKFSHSEREVLEFFRRAALEKQAFDQKVADAVYILRVRNTQNRAQDTRDLDEEYRNYIPPIV